MASNWLTTILKGITFCSVILGSLLLPWAGQAITNPPEEEGSTRVAVLYPSASPPLSAEDTSSLAPKMYIPIVESLIFHNSVVLLSDKPAFDKCNPPSIEQMQVWWDKSPYWSINIYMGGISLACDPYRLTPAWMHTVAQQGWTFIPTWVGLQAPCSKFKHRMSPDPAVSYLQGKAEAGEAVAAARNLGLMGDQVIYADIESYSGASSACRAAVASFLQGWVDGLHAQKAKAGAYGAACTSYVTEWAALSRPPDYVWLAHWYKKYYDPFASVWDTPCLSNSLWVNRQRIKQYTGPHIETWGDLSATLDSNTVDGAINAYAGQQAFPGREEAPAALQVREMHLLSPNQGWTMVGDRLLWTDNAGESWREITPPAGSPGSIQDALFLDTQRGWLVRHTASQSSGDELLVMSTADGGRSWQSSTLQVPIERGGSPLIQAYVEFVDPETGWLSLRLQSGSSFSLGRLFATRDGGRTWQERSLPLGEPVKFIDSEHGWVAGGPAGNQLFYTADGGQTWQSQTPSLPVRTSREIYYGLPVLESDRQFILPVTLGAPNPKLALFSTSRPGSEWTLRQVVDLAGVPEPSSPLPFSLTSEGTWWAASSSMGRLYTAQNASQGTASRVVSGMPIGTIALDFVSQQSGWAIVQDGNCVGQKSDTGSEAFECTSQSRLVRTLDGGLNWEEITPTP